MATLNLKVPNTSLTSPTSWGNRTSIVNMMNRIITNYGKFIKFNSENSKLPIEVIASFIAVESGGNASAGASGHVTQGLMQWNRNFAKNTLEAEYRLKRLSPAEKEKLSSFGINFDAKGQTRAITNADQLKPELNILIGSILLGQMVDSYHDGGKRQNFWAVDENNDMRLDRIIAVYNAGAYGKTGKMARQLTTPKYASVVELSNAVNPITRSYIAKVLGINGAMDVATKETLPLIKNLG